MMNEYDSRDLSDARMDIIKALRCLTRVKTNSPSRELSLALTKLEEAQMWLYKVN